MKQKIKLQNISEQINFRFIEIVDTIFNRICVWIDLKFLVVIVLGCERDVSMPHNIKIEGWHQILFSTTDSKSELGWRGAQQV